MKNLLLANFLLVFVILSNIDLPAQVSVNNEGSTPDNSAMLDVSATNRGLLIPRISTDARNQIPSPATGLFIYNSTTNQLNFFNGSLWFQTETTSISSTIGTNNPGGGVSINTLSNAPPDNSAMLDINNPTRGILIPRTIPELITSPAVGLLIYNTATRQLNYYNGTQWITLCASSSGIAGASGTQTSVGVSIKADNSNPHHSAILEVSANDRGVLIPRLTNVQRDALLPATGLIIYNISTNTVEYYDGTTWRYLIACSAPCGSTLSINHLVSGTVAPVNKTVNYGTVSGIPGEPSKCWITSNLGADHQATAVNDATEPSAGWYWQFNIAKGYKHDGTTRTPASAWTSDYSQNSNWTQTNDPCAIELGSGWRIPTSIEWSNVSGNGGGNWTTWNGPWNSDLKLHAAGYLFYYDGSLQSRGAGGYYWSSNQNNLGGALYIDFNPSHCWLYEFGKSFGLTVRCLKDAGTASIPTITTDPVTSIGQTTATSGGNVTYDGGTAVTARGICWSTSHDPATSDSHTSNGSGVGSFVSDMTGLAPGTPYYVRSYATNSVGTAYGNEVSFTTAAPFVIGQSYGGGKIFYIDGTGQHGLIAAPYDQGSATGWYNGTWIETGASATALGTGNANTNTIVSVQGAGIYAARLCYDLVIDAFGDWYLPSRDELYQLILNKDAIGGFSGTYYWSSSEESGSYASAWLVQTNNGSVWSVQKAYGCAVRAIRTF